MDRSPLRFPLRILYGRLGTAAAPVVIDVRRDAAFDADDRMLIVGASGAIPSEVDEWRQELPPDRPVVVYCVHGHEVSQQSGSRSARRRARRPLSRRRHRRMGRARPAARARRTPAGQHGWVTRERPKIDRIACPWLIRRFIDPEAEFLFVPTERVFAVAAETGATAYDIPGAEPFSHDGELCSFDAFLKVYGIEDPALDALALIVRGADTARLELTPQSPGLLALSLGLSANFPDDHAMLEHGMVDVRRALRLVPRPCRARRTTGRRRRAPEETKPWPRLSVAGTVPQTAHAHGVSLGEAFRVWLRVAALSFGGPAGQIAVMHRIIVDEKKWVGEIAVSACAELLHAAARPGGAAACHLYRLADAPLAGRDRRGRAVRRARHHLDHGVELHLCRVRQCAGRRGAVLRAEGGGARDRAAGGAPRRQPRAQKPGDAARSPALAFIGIFFLGVPFPLIVLAAGIDRLCRRARRLERISGRRRHGPGGSGRRRTRACSARNCRSTPGPPSARALRVSAIWLALWLVPVIAHHRDARRRHTSSARSARSSRRWPSSPSAAPMPCSPTWRSRRSRLMAGCGPAKCSTGSAWPRPPRGRSSWSSSSSASWRRTAHPGALPPMLAGTLGGLLATWCTFVPCFLWIGLGAPFIERLRDNKPLNGALAGITAAVVGVILNLAIWFALHTWFREAAARCAASGCHSICRCSRASTRGRWRFRSPRWSRSSASRPARSRRCWPARPPGVLLYFLGAIR